MNTDSDFMKRCPRCCSEDIDWKSVRIKNNIGKRVWCNTCGLTITNSLVDYVYWRWNRTKEDQAAYLIELVNKHPDNMAYCNKQLVEIWGGEERLCKFISVESGRKVICLPSTINPEGVLLKGL